MQQIADEFAPVRVGTSDGRFRATLECSCGHVGAWSALRMPSPEIVKGKFTTNGWDVRKRDALCPKCVAAETAARRARHARPAPEPAPTAQEEAMATMTDQPAEQHAKAPLTDAAKKAHRALMTALEIYYDEAGRAYKEGKSDAAIADELGLSAKYVAETREAYFGPLCVPSPVRLLVERVDKIEADFAHETNSLIKRYSAEIAAVRAEFDAAIKRNGLVM